MQEIYRFLSRSLRTALLALSIATIPITIPEVQAQNAAASATSGAETDTATPDLLNEDELEVLVARIAFYPDELVAVTTSASIFPLQIIEAQRFLDQSKTNKQEYASSDHDGDGVPEYAQKVLSTEGTRDGLYWPADVFDGEESPAGLALAEAADLKAAKEGEGFNGYHFRILTRQGDAVAGGAYDYVINRNMIADFGLVAWPVHYGISGVKTFVVNKAGILYEADLGERTSEIASKIETFNPSDDWRVVED